MGALSGNGPFDIDEVDPQDFLDFGVILVPPTPGLQLAPLQNGEHVVSLRLQMGTAVADLQVFAAPKSGGLWDESRVELRENLARAGVESEYVQTGAGTQLLVAPSENTADMPLLIVGYEGPRWLLRVHYIGVAAIDEDEREPLAQIVRQLVVRRGTNPIAPGDQMALTIPQQVLDAME
ncbi:MAG: DUF3710 domain-containing protein [Actinomycetaceae bacterium]|nr:DUF3710 domain-containing protein [Actinomycetaceae bacterium]